MTSLDFSHEDVERATAYHRSRYRSLLAGPSLTGAVYAALRWSAPGRLVWNGIAERGWAGSGALWAAIVVGVAALVQLPVAYWRGLVHERAWGFSTQTSRGWLADWAKGLVLSGCLAAAAWVAAVGLARTLPRWWPVAAAAALAVGVLVLSFLAPVVLDPIFGRFRPLEDEALGRALRELGEAAGVPVSGVFVTDASRRTTKVNAYVSGFGGTRRIVLYDTLLAAAAPADLRLVVAHELCHRRARHVVKGMVLAMASGAVAVAVLWATLGTRMTAPRELPVALLLCAGVELAGLAPAAAISRRWERAADRCSLALTGDLAAFERVHFELARRNLSDLSPPRLAYLLLFAHPTPSDRLALGRAWGGRPAAVGSGAVPVGS